MVRRTSAKTRAHRPDGVAAAGRQHLGRGARAGVPVASPLYLRCRWIVARDFPCTLRHASRRQTAVWKPSRSPAGDRQLWVSAAAPAGARKSAEPRQKQTLSKWLWV